MPDSAQVSVSNPNSNELVLAEVRSAILRRQMWAARYITSPQKGVERSLRRCWMSIPGSPRTVKDRSAGFCFALPDRAGKKPRPPLLASVTYLPVMDHKLVMTCIDGQAIIPDEPYAATSAPDFVQI